MYGVPFSSDESDSAVDLEQESDVSSHTGQSQRSTRKASTRPRDGTGVTVESYARWRTQRNRQGARALGSQVPPESVQEADDDSRSTTNPQGDYVADNPERLSAAAARWAAAWFPWICSPSSPPHLAPRATSSYIGDNDASFQEPLGPAMSTASSHEPADLDATTQRTSVVDRVYRDVRSVLYELDRFVNSVIPLAATLLLLSFVVLLGIVLCFGLQSYYYSLNGSTAMCDFDLISPFLRFCHTTNVTVDSPAMDIFADLQVMTERWIFTIEGTDRAGTMSCAVSDVAPQIFAFRKALYLSDLMTSGVLNEEIATLMDMSEANQLSWTRYSIDRLGAFERLWTELFAFGERLKFIKSVNENHWSPIILAIDTVRFLFPNVSHPGAMMIVNATVNYLSFLGDEIEIRLLPQGQELRRNLTILEEDVQRIEDLCRNEVGFNSHARSEKMVRLFWPFDHEENLDWFIQQKQSLKLYEPHRQQSITQLDKMLDRYREIGDDINDLIRRLEAPGAMKGFDQAHLESQIRNIDTLVLRLKFTNLEIPNKQTGIVSQMMKHSEESPTSSEDPIKTSQTDKEARTSSGASPESIQTGQHTPTWSEPSPEAIQIGQAHLTSSEASADARQDSREGRPTSEAYPAARPTVKEATVKGARSMNEAHPETSPMEEFHA